MGMGVDRVRFQTLSEVTTLDGARSQAIRLNPDLDPDNPVHLGRLQRAAKLPDVT